MDERVKKEDERVGIGVGVGVGERVFT